MKKILLLLILSLPCYAEDLISILNLAEINDPTIKAAKETHLANIEALPQALANFLPNLSADLSVSANRSTHPILENYGTHDLRISLTQSIFDYVKIQEVSQAHSTIKASVATLADATQDLIIRVASQYFAILKAEDDLNFAKAQRKAFSRHLEQTKQRFEVGLIAITDVHEAQARHDNAFAQEIQFSNLLEDQRDKLKEIIGSKIEKFRRLKDKIDLKPPQPNQIEHWTKLAREGNFSLQAKRASNEIAKSNINAAYGNHLPTVSLYGDIGQNKASKLSTRRRTTTKQLGVTLSVPLFNGGGYHSQTKQAAKEHQVAIEELELLHRNVISNTIQAYRGVVMQISQVNALKQTVVSSASALKATEAAFEVGTRTIVDVLNGQSDLLNAKRNYAKARYDYILELLKLKQYAGTLTTNDLKQVNIWLTA